MNEEIILREYAESDRLELEKIIEETWQYDRFCSKRTAAKMARVYLNNCLANQTFKKLQLLIMYRLVSLWARIYKSINVRGNCALI